MNTFLFVVPEIKIPTIYFFYTGMGVILIYIGLVYKMHNYIKPYIKTLYMKIITFILEYVLKLIIITIGIYLIYKYFIYYIVLIYGLRYMDYFNPCLEF